MNVGESKIIQPSKVTEVAVIFENFLRFNDPITGKCKSTHLHIMNIGKVKNLLSYDACSTIIHALSSCRLYYGNVILYNVPMN